MCIYIYIYDCLKFHIFRNWELLFKHPKEFHAVVMQSVGGRFSRTSKPAKSLRCAIPSVQKQKPRHPLPSRQLKHALYLALYPSHLYTFVSI